MNYEHRRIEMNKLHLTLDGGPISHDADHRAVYAAYLRGCTEGAHIAKEGSEKLIAMLRSGVSAALEVIDTGTAMSAEMRKTLEDLAERL